jgi:hypothetical protein
MVAIKDPYNFLPWKPEEPRENIIRVSQAQERQPQVVHPEEYERRCRVRLLSADYYILLCWLLLVLLVIAQWRLSC